MNNVQHPAHYNEHPSGVECIQVVQHLNFNVGNAVKYVWRAGLKGATVEDLRKAEFYLQFELNRLAAGGQACVADIRSGVATPLSMVVKSLTGLVREFYAKLFDMPNGEPFLDSVVLGPVNIARALHVVQKMIIKFEEEQ